MTRVCEICGGSGVIGTDDPFTTIKCECVFAEKVKKYIMVPDFRIRGGYAPLLRTTPLLNFLTENKNIIIEVDSNKVDELKSHLRTALVLDNNFRSFRVLTSSEFMSMSLNSDTSGVIHNTDVIIELATPFPYYEKAALRHEHEFSDRLIRQKLSWFVVENFQRELLNIRSNGLVSLLNDKSKFELVNLNKLISGGGRPLSNNKQPSTPQLVLQKSMGVDASLLNFHSEVIPGRTT